jgi:ABC-type Fe3+ transport system permease subunit
MRPDDVTMLVQLGLIVGAVLLWDAWLYLRGGYDATISGVIWNNQRRHWWVKWVALAVFAFLYWHWFL